MEIETDRHLRDLWVGPESRHTAFGEADQRGGTLSESAERPPRGRPSEIDKDRRQLDAWISGQTRFSPVAFVGADQRGGRLSERQRATGDRKTRETDRAVESDRREGDRAVPTETGDTERETERA